MPDYLTLYNGNSSLGSTHLENLSFVTNIASTATTSINTFWNSLPFDIRNSISLLLCENKLYKHLWNIALTATDIEQYKDEWLFQSSDDDG